MPARSAFLLSTIFFAALTPADFRRVEYAVLGPNKAVSPASTTVCARAESPGTRCSRFPEDQSPAKCSKNNRAPAASSFKASKSLVYLPGDCPAGAGRACAEGGMAVELVADAQVWCSPAGLPA